MSGKSKRGRPRKSEAVKEVKKSKSPSVKEFDRKSSQEQETEKTPALYVTIKNCVLCETSLRDHKVPWTDDLKKRFDSFCTFVNLELDDRHSWDFKKENFPFCSNCSTVLDYLHILYNRLERLHTNVALGVRKIRRIVLRTRAGEGGKGGSDKFQNSLKSSKSLEYRVKFVRAQIMTAMNDDDSDDEDIILPTLVQDNIEETSQSMLLHFDEENKLPSSNDVAQSASTPRFEVIRIKADEEQAGAGNSTLVEATTDVTPSVNIPKSLQDAETQYNSSDIAMEETEMEGEVEFGVGISNSAEIESQEYYSCDEVDDEPIDEFQAFLEEQLEKRRKAAMQAGMLATRPVEKEFQKPTVKNVEEETETPVNQQFECGDDVQLCASGTMDFFEEKPEIIEIDLEDEVPNFHRRSRRSRKKRNYSNEECVQSSDAEDQDDDFDIDNRIMEEGSNSEDGTAKNNNEDKHLHRQRKKSRLSKISQSTRSDQVENNSTLVSEKGKANVATKILPNSSEGNMPCVIPVKDVSTTSSTISSDPNI